MNIMNIVYASLSLGGLGLIFGVGLGAASKKFAVKEDPRTGLVRAALPGANCGGCGYPGCDACAAAIVNGEAKFDACTVGGAKVAKEVGKILGIETGEIKEEERRAAFVKCGGSIKHRTARADYKDAKNCAEAAAMNIAGSADCSYGCIGLGSCVGACKFGAITIVDGIALVDEEKCTSCGACVKECPKGLIEIVPVKNRVRVVCSSKEKGKAVKDACSAGCIGCTLCVKACKYDAIIFENNLAKVDYKKCVQCMECVKKCPTKAIRAIIDAVDEAAASK